MEGEEKRLVGRESSLEAQEGQERVKTSESHLGFDEYVNGPR
jgi:hypothetical protein